MGCGGDVCLSARRAVTQAIAPMPNSPAAAWRRRQQQAHQRLSLRLHYCRTARLCATAGWDQAVPGVGAARCWHSTAIVGAGAQSSALSQRLQTASGVGET